MKRFREKDKNPDSWHRRFSRAIKRISTCAALMVPMSGIAQVLVDEDFSVDPKDSGRWNLCQAFRYLNSPVSGQDSAPYSAYRLGTDGFHGTINCGCQRKEGCLQLTPKETLFYTGEVEADEETDLVSATLFPQDELLTFQQIAQGRCATFDPALVAHKYIVQKNEIRLWKDDWPTASSGSWYSFRFRIDGEIGECGSMRWVGGQIKAGDGGGSPVIAQRFDNGVFHITIEVPRSYDVEKAERENEVETDRFIIANSEKDAQDAGSEHQPRNNGIGKITCDLATQEKVPEDCINEGLTYNSYGMLPSVKDGQWIQMDYFVQLAGACKSNRDKGCDRRLEVWAQGEKIASIEGAFGAINAHKSPLKFKIGVYRDLQVGDAALVVDHFALREDPGRSWCPLMRLSKSVEECRDQATDSSQKIN